MLRILRDNSQSMVIYLLLVPIILVFALTFGPGGTTSCGGAGSEFAAVVDGDVIRQQDYAMTYNQRLDMFRRQMRGMELTPQMIESLGLKDQVIDQLINEKLLAHEAQRHGIMVSDDDLRDYLQETYGVKDVSFTTYERWVRQTFGQSVAQFEERARLEIAGQKLAQVVTDTVAVSDDEMLRDYMREHDRVMFSYVKFDPVADIEDVSSEAVQKALAEDGEAVQAYFDENAIQFRQPKKVRARQLVVALDRDASEEAVAEAKSKLEAFKKEIDSGRDFAEVAKAESDDAATQEKGGDLGWVERGTLAPVLDDAIFQLKTGEWTEEPVRTPQGLHLVRVEEIQPARAKTFDEAKEEAARKMLREGARNKATEARARAFLAKVKEGQANWDAMTLSEAEAREAEDTDGPKKPVRIDSPWVLKTQEALPRIGVANGLRDALFALSTDAPIANEPFKVGQAYYVVKLLERETPDLKKFEEDKDNLRDQALSAKRNQVYRDWLKNLRERATVKLNPELFPQKAES